MAAAVAAAAVGHAISPNIVSYCAATGGEGWDPTCIALDEKLGQKGAE